MRVSNGARMDAERPAPPDASRPGSSGLVGSSEGAAALRLAARAGMPGGTSPNTGLEPTTLEFVADGADTDDCLRVTASVRAMAAHALALEEEEESDAASRECRF